MSFGVSLLVNTCFIIIITAVTCKVRNTNKPPICQMFPSWSSCTPIMRSFYTFVTPGTPGGCRKPVVGGGLGLLPPPSGVGCAMCYSGLA